MYKIRIFVDDSSFDNINSEQKELDLIDGETVPICFTYNTLDFKLDIPFSYTYKIPMTPKNVSLLGLDIRNNILYSTRKQTYFVTVTIDNVHVFYGSLYVNEVSKNNISVNLKCATDSSINSLSSIKMYNAYDYLNSKGSVSISHEDNEHHYLDYYYNLKYNTAYTGRYESYRGRKTSYQEYKSLSNGKYLESFSPQFLYDPDNQNFEQYEYPLGNSKNQPCAFHNEMFLNGISKTFQIPIYINGKKSTEFYWKNSTNCMFIPTSSHYMDKILFRGSNSVKLTIYSNSVSIAIAPFFIESTEKFYTKRETYKETISVNGLTITQEYEYPNSVNVSNNIFISPNATFTVGYHLFDEIEDLRDIGVAVYYCEYNKSMGDNILIDRKSTFINRIHSITTFRVGDYFSNGITYKKDGTISFFEIKIPKTVKFSNSAQLSSSVYELDYKPIRFNGTAISDSNDIPSNDEMYSIWMPDISISDYIINYANIINQGTAYYSPVNDSIIIKNYNNITGLIDISEYVSEITKVSKIYEEHYIDIVNEVYDNTNVIYRFETNNTSSSNKTILKSILRDIPLIYYDNAVFKCNTIGESDKNIFVISTYSHDAGPNGEIMMANQNRIKDIIDNNGTLKQMIYANEKVEVTIKCSSKMLFDILSFDSKILLRQLNTTFILNKATLTKDGAKLVLIAI